MYDHHCYVNENQNLCAKIAAMTVYDFTQRNFKKYATNNMKRR